MDVSNFLYVLRRSSALLALPVNGVRISLLLVCLIATFACPTRSTVFSVSSRASFTSIFASFEERLALFKKSHNWPNGPITRSNFSCAFFKRVSRDLILSAQDFGNAFLIALAVCASSSSVAKVPWSGKGVSTIMSLIILSSIYSLKCLCA